jgi:hypothetical protein
MLVYQRVILIICRYLPWELSKFPDRRCSKENLAALYWLAGFITSLTVVNSIAHQPSTTISGFITSLTQKIAHQPSTIISESLKSAAFNDLQRIAELRSRGIAFSFKPPARSHLIWVDTNWE